MLENLLAELRILGLKFAFDPDISKQITIDSEDYVPHSLGSDFSGEQLNIRARFVRVMDFAPLKGMRLEGKLKMEVDELEGDVNFPPMETKTLELLFQGNFSKVDLSKVRAKELVLKCQPSYPDIPVQLVLGSSIPILQKLVIEGIGTIHANFSVRDLKAIREMHVSIPTKFMERKDTA